MSCPTCGHDVGARARFCEQCGTPLTDSVAEHPAPAAPPSLARERAPRDYTPRHLADRILQSRSALEGERKQLTVLFCDVKGSMDLAEELDPEAWHAILDRFFQILSEGVHRFEGTVNQYTGDGIMALFGAPIAHEDHAQRACYAALHLRDAMRTYTAELKRSRDIHFAVRMGLASGEVVVGKIGDDLRMDYTAQGHTAGIAQRMEQLADPGAIYLAEGTARLVGEYFELADLGEFRTKGGRAPVRAWELSGADRHRTRFEVSQARGLSRFVGRDEEMAFLEDALARALGGESLTVGIVAEAGTGKSRLIHEFQARCLGRGITTSFGRCMAHTESIPLFPLIEAYRSFFGLDESDDSETCRVKITGRMLRLDAKLAEHVPFMLDLLGVSDPGRPPPELEPEERIHRLSQVMGALRGGRVRREETFVAFLEDLHWIDDASAACLRASSLERPMERMLAIHTYRPEYESPWSDDEGFRELRLRPLSRESVDELITSLLGEGAGAGELAALIRERSGGNPFFVEEIVQSLVESGALVGRPGDFALVRKVTELGVPSTVEAILAARIDRLAEREKWVLQCASVVGPVFAEDELAHVTELADGELRDSLQTLVSSEFILEHALYPRLEYAFKHALTGDVAYRSQLQETRARSHAAVARSIEALRAEHMEERYALLAHHWEQAREPSRAAKWALRAAVWSRDSDAGEAVRHYRKVLALVGEDDGDEDQVRWVLAASIGLLRSGVATGLAAGEPHQALRRGRAAAERVGSHAELVDLLAAFSGAADLLGGEGLEAAREAARLVEGLDDPRLRVKTLLDLAQAEWFHKRSLPEAIAAVEAALVEVPDSWRALAIRARFLTDTGQLDQARSDLERAGELLPESAPTASRLEFLGRRCVLELRSGATESAESMCARVLELAERHRNQFAIAQGLWLLGEVCTRTQRPEEALGFLARSGEMIPTMRVSRYAAFAPQALMARACLALGQRERAREIVERIIDRVEQIPESRIELAHVMIALAEPGKLEEAEAYLERSERAAEANGSLYFRAPFLECRAALERRRGDEAAALRRLRAARDCYAEMGATGHAERLTRELEA